MTARTYTAGCNDKETGYVSTEKGGKSCNLLLTLLLVSASMGALTSYNGKNQQEKSASMAELESVLKACIYAATMCMAKTGKDPETLDAYDDKCLNAILLAILE